MDDERRAAFQARLKELEEEAGVLLASANAAGGPPLEQKALAAIVAEADAIVAELQAADSRLDAAGLADASGLCAAGLADASGLCAGAVTGRDD